MRAFTTRPEILGTFGVVTSTHWLASATGMAILEKGGNAFDAAVATGFALQVVEPHLNGPGGDLPVLLYNASAGRDAGHLRPGRRPGGGDHRSLPQARARSRARHRAARRGRSRRVRRLAAAAARPWHDARFATCSRRRSTLPVGATRWCRRSAPRSSRSRELFRAEWPSSAEVYLPGGDVPAPGRLFRNPRPGRHLHPRARSGGKRGRRSRGADRSGAERLVPGLRRRGDRPLLPRAGAHGHLGPPAPGPPHRRRSGALAGDDRSSRFATTTTATPS